jgi:tetratricopeptide (TPR) repeat protein
MIYLRAGETAAAKTIAEALVSRDDAHSRAYGHMLEGMRLEAEGNSTLAIIELREAIAIADLWLIRLQIGKVYLRAGNAPAALDEFNNLGLRNGEASAVFLDHYPTFRVLSELPYWWGRVQEGLQNPASANISYEQFLALRPQGGTLAADAEARIASLD